MGVDKALVEFEGRPLIARALGILREAGLAASIAGARSDLRAFAAVIDDPGVDEGPLGGICAAMAVTPAPWAVFVPVDMPLLPASLIALLLDHARITSAAVTAPAVSGFTQTFPAVLNRDVLPVLQRELEGGRGGCFAAFNMAAEALGQQVNAIAAEVLVQTGQVKHPEGLPASCWFFNLNCAADVQQAHGYRRGLKARPGLIA